MKSLLLILFLLFQIIKITGQEPFEQHFSIVNGLPSNAVYSILEDKQGFIWFTCNEGLFRYDGMHYKSYRNKNQTNYAGSNILQDSKGRIWYENFDGYSFYVEKDSLKEFPQVSVANFFPLQVTKSFLFIQENGNLVAINIQTLKPEKRFKTSDFIYATTTFNNEFYFIDKQTLYKINNHLRIQKIAEAPLDATEFPFLASDKKSIYLTKKQSDKNGVWKLNVKSFEKIANITSNQIIQNTRIFRHELFFLTTTGLCRFNLTTKTFRKPLLESKNSSDLLIDFKGNYWLTSTVDGIFIVPDFNTKQYTFDFIQPFRSINFRNKLLISSKNEKVVWFNPTSSEFEVFASGNTNAIPYYLFVDSLRNQVVRVQSDGFTYFSDLNTKKLIQKSIIAIKKIIPIDSKYNAFVSSGLNGFYCHKNDLSKLSALDYSVQQLEKIKDGDFIFFRLPLEGRGKSVFLDPNSKNIYFTTNAGTFRLKNGNALEQVFGVKSKMIVHVFSWNKQIMALGYDGYIHTLTNNSTTTKNKKLNEIQNCIQIKQIDKKLYVRTNNQIIVFGISKKGITQFYTSINLKNSECNDFCVVQNEIWIMTPNGFIKWHVYDNRKQKKVGRFEITSLYLNGEIVSDISKPLHYYQNNLKVEFALLDYGISTISSVEYKINDQNWTSIDSKVRSLNFPVLASGSYKLQFRGKLNSKYLLFKELNFEINPPFWSTIWFILIIILSVSVIVIWYFRRKIKANRILNQLMNEKIILESNLNKSLLASIKSQMNPHFIFNALNTIQAYIYMNDKKNATGYLSKFSKLTRSILELSEKEEITLSEDIKTLTLYLELEKMRFQDGFEYIIETADIDINSVKIPPMMLQPYVENAIKHGLLHNEGDKRLSINMRQEKNVLTICIDDNGIGRKKSAELNFKRNKYHEGFATNANEKRLDLLNENNEISVVFTDKYTDAGQAIGTTVQLKIRIK